MNYNGCQGKPIKVDHTLEFLDGCMQQVFTISKMKGIQGVSRNIVRKLIKE